MARYATRKQIERMWRWITLVALIAGSFTLASFGAYYHFWQADTIMYRLLYACIALLWGFLPVYLLAFTVCMFLDWRSRPANEFPEGPDQRWRRPFGLPPQWYYRDVIVTSLLGYNPADIDEEDEP
ncbi:MAG: hypothetical protein ABH838_02480 [Actinomycetota bacterium]